MNGIRRYVFGNVIDTEAVLSKPEPSEIKEFPLNMVQTSDGIIFSGEMSETARVYGLGQSVRGINKRGWRYVSDCSDEPHHLESKNSLYGAHNFILIADEGSFTGFFFDSPERMEFDIGFEYHDRFKVTTAADVDVYEIDGPSAREVVRSFRSLIGESYIPPLWGFGYGQSRWSYMNEDEVREVIRGYRDADIPLDSVYLDIDYMDRYQDFTVDEKTFPAFETFVQEMKKDGVHLVPIIDAAIKVEDGYYIYEEGIKNQYFCTNGDGQPFVGAVWPGHSHFPDFLRKEVREWFGDHYSYLIDQGIDGFWNDMNEPAMFYTLESIRHAVDRTLELTRGNMGIREFFELSGIYFGLNGNKEDYKLFFHRVNDQLVRHDKVHNIYGMNMTRAAGEAFYRNYPDRRILMFSRASYIGAHRYAGIWMGDNSSWWSHLALNVKMLPSLNMVGFLYTGADMGGFMDDTTEDLLLRWMGIAVFSPLMRNHAAMNTRRQELYRFAAKDAFSKLLHLRYALIPYLYSEYVKAAKESDMLFRPLAFDYPEDGRACEIEDQLMVGESLMIAPVTEQNVSGRRVYLPEPMKCLRMRSDSDYDAFLLPAGDHYMEAGLHEVLVFVRPGHILPLGRAANRTRDLDGEIVNVISCGRKGEQLCYGLYEDDGITPVKDYKNHIREIKAEGQDSF